MRRKLSEMRIVTAYKYRYKVWKIAIKRGATQAFPKRTIIIRNFLLNALNKRMNHISLKNNTLFKYSSKVANC